MILLRSTSIRISIKNETKEKWITWVWIHKHTRCECGCDCVCVWLCACERQKNDGVPMPMRTMENVRGKNKCKKNRYSSGSCIAYTSSSYCEPALWTRSFVYIQRTTTTTAEREKKQLRHSISIFITTKTAIELNRIILNEVATIFAFSFFFFCTVWLLFFFRHFM